METNKLNTFRLSDLLDGSYVPKVITPDDPLTLGNICARFGAIRNALDLARMLSSKKVFEDRIQAYSALKMIVSEFVGWDAKDENYATERAYDLVVNEIIKLLRV
jgi:hypothetical protein